MQHSLATSFTPLSSDFFKRSVRQMSSSPQRNSNTTQLMACGPPHVSCFLQTSACSEPSSMGVLHRVHPGCRPQFNKVLVAGLNQIHRPTLAAIGFDHSALLFHLPVKRKYNLRLKFKLSASAMSLDSLASLCANDAAPSIMYEIHVVSTVHQRYILPAPRDPHQLKTDVDVTLH